MSYGTVTLFSSDLKSAILSILFNLRRRRRYIKSVLFTLFSILSDELLLVRCTIRFIKEGVRLGT